jgi:hypothetical protein
MAGVETIERLRQYLCELSPQARALLIGEFERSLRAGDEAASTSLVLQQMRGIVREQREGAPRIGHCARLFFKPFEPFLVDDRADHNHPGRLARSSLDSLWTWLRRDLLPEDAKNLTDEVNDALLAGDVALSRTRLPRRSKRAWWPGRPTKKFAAACRRRWAPCAQAKTRRR